MTSSQPSHHSKNGDVTSLFDPGIRSRVKRDVTITPDDIIDRKDKNDPRETEDNERRSSPCPRTRKEPRVGGAVMARHQACEGVGALGMVDSDERVGGGHKNRPLRFHD